MASHQTLGLPDLWFLMTHGECLAPFGAILRELGPDRLQLRRPSQPWGLWQHARSLQIVHSRALD